MRKYLLDLDVGYLEKYTEGKRALKELEECERRVVGLERDNSAHIEVAARALAELGTANARAKEAESALAGWRVREAAYESQVAQWKTKCETAERKLIEQLEGPQGKVAQISGSMATQRRKAERLRGRAERAEAESASLHDTNAMLMGQLQQSRDTAASLRAKVDRLRKELSARNLEMLGEGNRLAAATELLEQAEGPNAAWRERCDAFLANASVAESESEAASLRAALVDTNAVNSQLQIGNEALRARVAELEMQQGNVVREATLPHLVDILDAWASVPTSTLHVWANHPSSAISKASRAELARRESKP